MNVYEETHRLVQAIKESEEFKTLQETKVKLEENKELADAVKDFEKKSAELQAKQMLGEEDTSEMLQKVSELSAILMQDPLAAEYLQAQIRFSIMIKDVFDILGEAVPLGN